MYVCDVRRMLFNIIINVYEYRAVERFEKSMGAINRSNKSNKSADDVKKKKKNDQYVIYYITIKTSIYTYEHTCRVNRVQVLHRLVDKLVITPKVVNIRGMFYFEIKNVWTF